MMSKRREIGIIIIFTTILSLVFLFNTWFWDSSNIKEFHHTIAIPVLLGFQLIYGVGVTMLFSRSSIKIFVLGILFNLLLLFVTGRIHDLVPNSASPSYPESLVTLSYYAPIFALMGLLTLAAYRIIKFGISASIAWIMVKSKEYWSKEEK